MLNKSKKQVGRQLKQHHHVWINKEFIQDCLVWCTFLTEAPPVRLCRPFIDFRQNGSHTVVLDFFSDASLNPDLGFGAVFNDRWMAHTWPAGFVNTYDPSIEYLELFALAAALFTWNQSPLLQNSHVVIHCDNEAVVHMINNSASSCPQCMKILRMIVLDDIKKNRHLFV